MNSQVQIVHTQAPLNPMMKRLCTVLLMAAAAALLWTQGVKAMDLDRYRWQHRLLLLFAPQEDTPAYAAAAADIDRRSEEILDRDLVVFHLLEDGMSRVDGRRLSDAEARQLRDRFEIAPGRFTAVLIGKDGGVKLVRRDSVDLQAVFDRIDAMPMRQREMREKPSSRRPAGKSRS